MGVECQVLIEPKRDRHYGDIIYINEGPPYHLEPSPGLFFIVIVTDATKEDIAPLLEPLMHELDIEDEGQTWKLTRKYVSENLPQKLRGRIAKAIKAEYGVSDSNIDNREVLFRFRKSGASLAKLKELINDVITYQDVPNKFKIKSSVIDNAISNNNYKVEITFSQLQNNIINKGDKA